MDTTLNNVVGNNQDPELIQKKKEYILYIDDHIRNVQKAYNDYFVPLLNNETSIVSEVVSKEELLEAIRNVSNKIEEHDASKYFDEEFDGYRAHFHPTNLEKSMNDEYQKWVKEEFDKCWKHHYENNCHHVQFWVNFDTGEITDMTLPAIVEMLCDWIAMSMHFKSSTRDWYENDAEKEKNYMTSNTKDIVEDILYNIISGPEL